jgi:hypothetical protein
MKDELKSQSQAEIWRGGKIRKSQFFRPSYFSAILLLGGEPWSAGSPRRNRLVRRLVHRSFNEGGSRLSEGGCGEGGSRSVKVGQSDSVSLPRFSGQGDKTVGKSTDEQIRQSIQ